LSADKDIILTTVSFPGPTVLVLGGCTDASLELAAAITAAYSDAEICGATDVRVMGGFGERISLIKARDKQEFKKYMI
jgi:hypothetical protein